MKKWKLSYALLVALFLIGIGVGLLSAKVFEGTYAQVEEPKGSTLENPQNEKQLEDKATDETVAQNEDKADGEDSVEDDESVEKDESVSNPTDNGNDGGNIVLPNRPLGESKSWWFTRNTKNLPPEVDKGSKEILAGKGYYIGNTSQKIIYLTFDEGYENGNTGKILDILRDNGVPAAFFVTGKYIDDQPKLVKRMVAEGHIVGNHTENHPSMPKISNEVIKEELQVVENKFKKLTGQKMNYLRPPQGDYNARTLEASKLLGYDTIFWSMAYRDWDTQNQPGREAAYNHVMDNIHNGAIILLHAVSDSNTEALDDIIKDLKKQGYVFASLDQLRG